jgi:hypothetical protein
VNFVTRRFTLESGLLVGLSLAFVGAVIDVSIAAKWISQFGSPMLGTVHLAFVATTALVLGLNLVFSSFLLNLIIAETPGKTGSSLS